MGSEAKGSQGQLELIANPACKGLNEDGVLRILLVNGLRYSLGAIREALGGRAHRLQEAHSPAEAIAQLAHEQMDLVILDLHHWQSRTLEICRLIKKNSATQFLPVYVLGNKGSVDEEVRALEMGADEYLTLPLEGRAFQARLAGSLRRRAMIHSLDDSENVLFSLAQSVEERDPDLGQHCHRLALMGAAMALALGLPPEDVFALQRGGYLHDVGKVAVPDQVLFKPGPLTEIEWETMKTHAERGERICQGMRSLSPVLPIIRHHHERWDGSGYPDGLRGEEIPLLARILQLADIFDALTTTRPYKSAMNAEEALRTIRVEAARGWRDPKLVEIFADLIPQFQLLPNTTLNPPFRAGDQCGSSLHALAASIEKFRREPAQEQKIQLETRSGLRLVSGF
ncbi:MAG TPA: HD domain-containing phosphohydrolase [Bryobacteraceae bacterium]|jgi:putative two-component system response regulator|nr:HD domain-containing phosphohydrolase [Bryobacteraceae bacterium]